MAVLLAIVGVLVCWCASAQAKLYHPFVSSFGSFASVQGVAVESTTGTVYVYDGGAGTIYKFDASGTPVNFTATGTNAISVGFALGAEGEIAVDSSSGPAKGDIYVAHAGGSIEIYGATGSKLGELTESSAPWGEACGVAVDSSGRVYVGLYYGHVNLYGPSANPVTNADYITSLSGLNGVCNVTADSAANVFADTWEKGPVTGYEASQFGAGSASGSVIDEAGSTLTVDPSNDELYVDEQGQVAQFGPHGKPFKRPVLTFASAGPGSISGSYGIAVSGFNRDVYVSDGKGAVSVFGPMALENVVPAIEEQYVTDVAGTSATMHGGLNAEGRDTTYRFEYGLTAGYGSETAEVDAGAGLTSASVQAHVEELQPSTVYHYRLVAANSMGTTYGPDQTFTTQSVGSERKLLDSRQWELVSPPDKHGANLLPIFEGVVQAADDGHAITYVTIVPTELEPEGNEIREQVLSTRSSGAWHSQDIGTRHDTVASVAPGNGFEYRSFSSDLSLGLVEPRGAFTPLSSEATERTAYVRHNVECAVSIATCYTPLLTAVNVSSGAEFGGTSVFFAGASADLQHVVMRSVFVGLTTVPGDEGGLYEWANGQLQIVSLLPETEGGAPSPPVLTELGLGQDARNAVSSDGSRIFWTGGSSRGLYMRDTIKHETLRIGSGRDRFQMANLDGSRVFFVTGGNALEVCDVVETAGKLACETTQLAPSVNGGVLGASDDGSYVYFVSRDALAPGANAVACDGTVASSCNLYVVHHAETGWETPELIGVLSAADSPDWAGENLGGLTARVTGNGRWLAFMSQRGLTGYDTHDAITGQPDEEVYVYDADAKLLTCTSCDPTGSRPIGMPYGGGYFGGFLGGGDKVWETDTMLAANIPGWTSYTSVSALYQSRYLSDQGRLFFNSRDALVPQDVNGTWDVYEYEPAGVGNCTRAAQTLSASASGCVDLVSSGGSPDESAFMDASETGDDVFFLTTSHLASQDFDTSYDIYDARVCSASAPCAPVVVSPPSCSTGDSCKAAPSSQPSAFGAPASATFAGAGNLSGSSEGVKRRSVSRAQRLKRALKACHRMKSKRKRMKCERKARRRYRANKATRGNR